MCMPDIVLCGNIYNWIITRKSEKTRYLFYQTQLMKYKLLGRSGLKVSELCLGTMGFGTEAGWGADKETSFAIMDAFANAGGNFIDTANMYKLGTSEKIIGEYLGNHDRDYFVVATKYSLKDNVT